MRRVTTVFGDVFLVNNDWVKLLVRGQHNNSTRLTGEWQNCPLGIAEYDGSLLLRWAPVTGDGRSSTLSAKISVDEALVES